MRPAAPASPSVRSRAEPTWSLWERAREGEITILCGLRPALPPSPFAGRRATSNRVLVEYLLCFFRIIFLKQEETHPRPRAQHTRSTPNTRSCNERSSRTQQHGILFVFFVPLSRLHFIIRPIKHKKQQLSTAPGTSASTSSTKRRSRRLLCPRKENWKGILW